MSLLICFKFVSDLLQIHLEIHEKKLETAACRCLTKWVSAKYFAKFRWKQMWQSLLFAWLQVSSLQLHLKRLWNRFFPLSFAKFLNFTFLTHVVESLFIKVACLQLATLSEKRLQCRCFILDFVSFLIHFKFQKQSFAGVLQNRFSLKLFKTQRKIPVTESLLSKVKGLQPATLIEKKTLAKVFYSGFCKVIQNMFFT